LLFALKFTNRSRHTRRGHGCQIFLGA
jgi:hypothetical protein